MGPSASAHTNVGSYYTKRWQSSVETGGAWLYVKSGSGGLNTDQNNRVIDAKQKWNDAPPTMWFDYKGFTGNAWGSCDAPRNRNIVFRNLIDGDVQPPDFDTYGRNVTCPEDPPGQANEIDSFYVRFDSGNTFYEGNGQSTGGLPDLYSVLVHEFGHSNGWKYHFDDPNDPNDPADPGGRIANDPVCNNDEGQETMCMNIYDGTIRMRTLGAHDIDVFDRQY